MQNRSNKKVQLRWRRTKIVATIGPSTDTARDIKALITAGVNVFRLNMSHGDHRYHRKVFKRIRICSTRMGLSTGILMDLCGPKIRVGNFEQGSITLKKGSKVIISCNQGMGREGYIISRYRQLYRDVKKGERILLDDGNMECVVEQVEGRLVHCKVVYGGTLKNNKGLNLPDSDVSISSFTEKDKQDVKLAMELQADFIALSFVREVKDIVGLRRYMRRNGQEIPVIAKIERPEAVNSIDTIIEQSFAIMIARGDLGIELPAEEVPLIQRDLIAKAKVNHCPVIVATQMMESMITNSRPTRAEVGDVASAAISSADAVMLSAETAVGLYPVKAVRMMDKILREIEAHQWSTGVFGEVAHNRGKVSSRSAIAHAANSLAEQLKLQGIIVPTTSGMTAAVLSSCRPAAPMMGASSSINTCRKLSLYWGVLPYCMKEEAKNWKVLSQTIAKNCKLTKTGNSVLLVSGFNKDERLNEPVLKIIKIER